MLTHRRARRQPPTSLAYESLFRTSCPDAWPESHCMLLPRTSSFRGDTGPTSRAIAKPARLPLLKSAPGIQRNFRLQIIRAILRSQLRSSYPFVESAAPSHKVLYPSFSFPSVIYQAKFGLEEARRLRTDTPLPRCRRALGTLIAATP